MKYLIINADDFGLSPSVNRGIVEVFQIGNITSASLMVNMPGFRDAVRWAKRYPGLSVGLHFNLTYGRPVSTQGVSSLVDSSGRFSSRKGWEGRHITRELHAQWGKFCEMGIRPTHIDSHQLIQTYPNVYPCISKFALEKKVPMRLTVPRPSKLIHPMTTDYLIGETYDSADAKEKLKSKLKGLRHGITELYCHPGYVDRYVRRYSTWTTIRERELAVFKSVNVRYLAERYGIRLINYRNLTHVKGHG